MNRSCIFCNGKECVALLYPECKGLKSDKECSFYKSKKQYYKDKNGYIQPFNINNNLRR